MANEAVEIPKHYADTFKSNVFHQAQQKGMLSGSVRVESHSTSGETVYYDSYKKSDVQKRTERAQNTNITTTERDRRAVRADWYDKGEYIDKMDTVKMMHEPTSPLTQAFVWAFQRNKDKVIYEAGLGDAYTGRKGLDKVVLPTTQKLVAFDGTTTGGIANLNVATLAKLKRKFWDNNVGTGNDLVMPGAMFNIALRGSQIEQMLNDKDITSQDYNSIRALVRGEIDTFMGFKFHIYNGVEQDDAPIDYNNTTGALEAGGTNTGTTIYDRCLVWYRDGILLSMGQDMNVKVSERDDKSYVKQLYADMHLGGTRMEEEKVIELVCKA